MQQKALYLDSLGGEYVIKTKDIQKPAPGEVLVKLFGTALNPADWIIPKLKLPILPKYPALLGADAAGVIEELGEGVTTFKKGDRVIFEASWSEDYASFQQYTLAAAEHVSKLPDSISFLEAASVPLALATAVIGLYADCDREAGVKKLSPPPWEAGGEGAYKGKPVIVTGGATSVGQFAIQLLRLSGFSKIITTASHHNFEFVKSLGATHVIDRNADFIAETKKILNGEAVDIIFDPVGPAVQAQALEVLAPGGQLVAPANVHVDKSKYPGKHFVTLYAGFRLPQYWALGASLASKLTELLESGAIKPNRIEEVPNGFAGAVEGMKRLENFQVSGKKLVLNPQDTP